MSDLIEFLRYESHIDSRFAEAADRILQLETQVSKYQNAFDRIEDAFAVMKEMTRKAPPKEET